MAESAGVRRLLRQVDALFRHVSSQIEQIVAHGIRRVIVVRVEEMRDYGVEEAVLVREISLGGVDDMLLGVGREYAVWRPALAISRHGLEYGEFVETDVGLGGSVHGG